MQAYDVAASRQSAAFFSIRGFLPKAATND
jgi:hypothetical protein